MTQDELRHVTVEAAKTLRAAQQSTRIDSWEETRTHAAVLQAYSTALLALYEHDRHVYVEEA